MTAPYLEISFRHGRPFAAYVHCAAPRPIASSCPLGHGLVLDLDQNGIVLGVEVTDPEHVTADLIVEAMRHHGVSITRADLAPLAA
jgi:uncharacterized protein YuzE